MFTSVTGRSIAGAVAAVFMLSAAPMLTASPAMAQPHDWHGGHRAPPPRARGGWHGGGWNGGGGNNAGAIVGGTLLGLAAGAAIGSLAAPPAVVYAAPAAYYPPAPPPVYYGY
jgi:hypothetical protein